MTLEWSLEVRSDGVALTLGHRVELGVLRVRERLHPLRSARALFAEAASRLPAATAEHAPIEALVTIEGEHAAFAVTRGEVAGEPYLRCLGAIFGDDWTHLIDAGSVTPAHFEIVEHTARYYATTLSLGLGHRRVRRVRYTPPAQWSPLARGLDTEWLAPGFPRQAASVVVHAARPADRTRHQALEDLIEHERLRGLELDPPVRGRAVFTAAGLAGTQWSLEARAGGQRRRCEVVLLEDDRFLYAIVGRFGETDPESLAVLDALVATIEPVPLPRPRTTQDSMLHWAT